MSDKVSWPAWRYGPGGAAEVFDNEKDVPAGWADHPTRVKEAVAKPAAPATPKPPVVPAPQAGTAVDGKRDVDPTLDADGWPWDPELHSATKTRTGADLWRMKVGVKRPAPKPKLDL